MTCSLTIRCSIFLANLIFWKQTFDRDGNGFIGASDLHNTYLAINENLTDDEVARKVLLYSFNLVIVLFLEK